MAIDEKLTESVRKALADVPSVSEVKMFGSVEPLPRRGRATMKQTSP